MRFCCLGNAIWFRLDYLPSIHQLGLHGQCQFCTFVADACCSSSMLRHACHLMVQNKAVRFPARQQRDLSEYKEGGTYNAYGQAQVRCALQCIAAVEACGGCTLLYPRHAAKLQPMSCKQGSSSVHFLLGRVCHRGRAAHCGVSTTGPARRLPRGPHPMHRVRARPMRMAATATLRRHPSSRKPQVLATFKPFSRLAIHIVRY
jgi:hypothetical protein